MDHDIRNHKLVKTALMKGAKQTGISYLRFRELFIDGDIDTTVIFWHHFYTDNPYKTYGVDFCHNCKKFHLQFVKPLVPWSLQHDLDIDSQILH